MLRAPWSGSGAALLCLSLLFVATPGPAAQGSRSAQVDALFASLEGKPVPGAAVLVVRDGVVVHRAAYGLANVELGVPNTPETVFRIASVTKQFTAMAILQLCERGKLRLDDRLAAVLPGFPGRRSDHGPSGAHAHGGLA